MKFLKMTEPIIFDTKISDISKEVLRELYRMMLKIRKVQLKIDEFYHQDEMRTPVHLCIGQYAEETITPTNQIFIGGRCFAFSGQCF